MTLRRATPADAEAMLGLRVLMFEEMGLPGEQVDDPAWRRAALTWFVEHLDRPHVRGVIVEVDGVSVSGGVGEIQGLIPGPTTPGGSTGLISNVATLPQHRGAGHARAVMEDLVRWFRDETDVGRIDLFATRSGARIYERLGFADVGQPAMRLRVDR